MSIPKIQEMSMKMYLQKSEKIANFIGKKKKNKKKQKKKKKKQ